MFAAPFSRLLWKEYRSLRMLWTGCALGTLGLWLFLYLVTLLSTESIDATLYLMHAFWSLALWLPAIYLLGCTVATFAGEKEERTADWLINTARPFGSLFTAKVIWPVVSAGAMQLLLFGAAALIRQYFLATTRVGSIPADEMLPEFWSLATFALVEALVWGLFWSLQLSRAMPAAVLAAICIVLINFSVVNLNGFGVREWERWLGSWGLVRTAVAALLLLVDVALARRWIAGRGVEWSIPWHRFVIHRTVSHASPAVEQAVPWRRAWQRFRWLERQSTRIFLVLTVLWSLLTTIPMVFWPRQLGPGPTFITLFFLPLFAGMAAWQGEQSRFQFRFLAYRGVSPFWLWLNKFVVWLMTLVIATLVVVIINWLGHELGQAVFLKDGHMADRINAAIQRSDPTGTILSVSAYFTLFVSAFTAGLYFRRTIFAFGAGFLLHVALFYWPVASYVFGFPVWLSILPLMVWLVWCSVRHLPRWYLERSGWRWNGVIAAEWLIFPLLYVAAVTAYWVYSVPLPNVAQLLAIAPRPISGQYGAPFDREWHEAIQRAEQLAAARERIVPESIGVALWHIPQPQWSQLEPDVRALREALLKPAGVGPSSDVSYKLSRAGLGIAGLKGSSNVLSLMQLAEQSAFDGQFEESIQSVRAAVRYEGTLQADLGLNFLYGAYGADREQILWMSLKQWAEHPNVTPELIQRTLADLEKSELRWWLTDPLSLEKFYQVELQGLNSEKERLGVRHWLLQPWLVRQQRLKACELSNRLRFLRTPPTGPLYGGLASWVISNDSDPAWSYQGSREPLYQGGRSDLPVGLSPQEIVALRDRETRIRCLFATMAAEAYRKQHGQLPRDLSQVVPQIASRELLTDPWSTALLQIQPQGVPGELWDMNRSQKPVNFTPGTPFIWSVGPSGFLLYPTAPHSGFYRFTPTRHTTAYMGSREPYYIYPLSRDHQQPANQDGQPADALRPAGAQATHPLGAGAAGLFAPEDAILEGQVKQSEP